MRRLFLLSLLLIAIVFQAGVLKASVSRESCSSEEIVVRFEDAVTNDPAGTIDPYLDKDVGCTTVSLSADGRELWVLMSNCYPGYRPLITASIQNCGEVPVFLCELAAESSESVWLDYQFPKGLKLLPGETIVCTITAGIYQNAQEQQQYAFRLLLSFCQLFVGSPGFWGHIDRNQQFSLEDVEEWLCLIDDSSSFLGPRTIEQMLAFFRDKSSNPENRFLKHYLAMRLNVFAGLLELDETHDVTLIDTENYLGLANPESATLGEIINAVESKYGTNITRNQYLLMKTICDEINHYHI